MRKTKIICTLGPSTDKDGVLRELVANGMNVARFNFSHGSYEEHKGRLDMLKAIRAELNKPVAALLDTKGPEIRLKEFKNGVEMLEAGQTFTLTTREVEGTKEICSITYKDLPQDVHEGGTIMLDDGLIKLQIQTVNDTDIVCTVLNNGKIKNKKGVNVPGVHLSMPYMSQRDKDDIIFGIEQGFDFIAASFVRTAQDVYEIRNLLNEYDSNIRIIAKIENQQGVDNIDSIIEAADGIMIARGDMGVEIPLEDVPVIQKDIIAKVYSAGKQVITATQMLDSMIKNPRPTRAETTDVANAIYQGTSAIMLSGETAAGKYPVDALQMMAEIAEMTEPHLDYKVFIEHRSMDGREKISSAVALATVRTAKNLKANAIVTPTMSGNTARLISNFRPKVPIYAITPNSTIQHKLQLIWGVTPLKGYQRDTTDHIMSQAMNVVRSRHLIHKGDLVVFTAGDPATNMTNGHGAVTNMMHVIEAE